MSRTVCDVGVRPEVPFITLIFEESGQRNAAESPLFFETLLPAGEPIDFDVSQLESCGIQSRLMPRSPCSGGFLCSLVTTQSGTASTDPGISPQKLRFEGVAQLVEQRTFNP